MPCIARLARGKVAFGNGKNYFYLEARCDRETTGDGAVCDLCSQKNPKCRMMDSRQFDHGLVTDPIPPNSHIYGGEWYNKTVSVYGEPSADVLARASTAATAAQLCKPSAATAAQLCKPSAATAAQLCKPSTPEYKDAAAVEDNMPLLPPAQVKKVAAMLPQKTIRADYVEVPTTFADVHEIVRVNVIIKVVDGVEYYYDEATDTLFTKYENGGMGPPKEQAK